MLSFAKTWAVARYELTWDLRKKRTYFIVGLFLFASFVYGYLFPIIFGKSIAAGQNDLGIVFGRGLWWVEAIYLAFNTFVTGLFSLLVGGITAADSLASEFDRGTIVPLLSQPVTRLELYAGKFLEKVLLMLAVSVFFTLLVLAGSEASVGAQAQLNMFPLLVLAEFGAFLEFAALAFFFGSFARSGAMVLGILIALGFGITVSLLLLGVRFGLQEVMFLVPLANAGFLFSVIPWYIVQPWGVMVLQGYVIGAGSTVPVVVTVVSALQYVLAGLSVSVVGPLVAGYYLFRRAEVRE